MGYAANDTRYTRMNYRRCGKSGVLLPAISLGLWHNFGSVDSFDNMLSIIKCAFNNGITHFDLANNYGPEPGSAEENLGRVLAREFKPYRDELFISTKAGYLMWPGPYGDWGSKKYMVASLDQSLKRLGVDYVDLFYSHRFDPNTPLEETMSALDLIVRQGKALYVGISNYPAREAQRAAAILSDMGTPCLIHQPRYSILDRGIANGLLDILVTNGIGCIAYSPLAQGLLTNRYLEIIPEGSRISKPHGFLKSDTLTGSRREALVKLNEIALERGQTLAQMAIAWLLKDSRVTSVLIGASSEIQLQENLKSIENIEFSAEELALIDRVAMPVMLA